MNHLTIEEIIEFVSLSEFNAEAVRLASAVNTHIVRCEQCLRLVQAFQSVYGEFERMNRTDEFRKYAKELLLNAELTPEKTVQLILEK